MVRWEDGVLHLRVAARPVEGRANAAAAALIAQALGVPATSVVLERGQRSREKRFEVKGLTKEEVARRLAALTKGSPPPAGSSEGGGSRPGG